MPDIDANETKGDPYRTTCRVPYVEPELAPPVIREKLRVLPMRRNILLTLAHSHGLFPHFSGLLGACFDGAQRLLPAKYEYDVNLPVAEVFCFPPGKIEAMGCSHHSVLGGKGPWTDRDRVILRIVDEQLEACDNKPDTITDALKALSVEGLVEVLMIIGIYALLARVMKALKVDDDQLDPDLKEKIKSAITA
ncbi:hypothetical protein BO78DRAFT_471157 [Aspergillus sclerotiicarbonarius CBS 121057]|uniref:Carboxymuconolactone decarboxylase-like domain-containing protein n=1 Tax=Aspergillus sclerotiicarbonarius (strain CBS 121057 / IBT 28362) TaxID=1448318 RepID=A0A319E9B7_ASPSB|nr:hypothetical protein BO78DRAFT_471157 [Aspergillus sclerotiicarbonarius CBS 121057]